MLRRTAAKTQKKKKNGAEWKKCVFLWIYFCAKSRFCVSLGETKHPVYIVRMLLLSMLFLLVLFVCFC